jgi:hypothetical protein
VRHEQDECVCERRGPVEALGIQVESVRMGVGAMDGRTFVSMAVMKRALARTARLSPAVSAWDVDGGDMATWKARAAARVSGTRTGDMVMVVSGCT